MLAQDPTYQVASSDWSIIENLHPEDLISARLGSHKAGCLALIWGLYIRIPEGCKSVGPG